MSYGLSSDPFMLKEGTLYVGTYASYPITASADPASVYTGDNIGYFRMGTINVNIPRSFSEFRSNTPSKRVRKDLIQKDLNLECELGQWNSDLLQLIFGTTLVTNAGNFDNHFIGSDETTGSPGTTAYGYRLVTSRTDGVAFEIGIWTGRCYSESPSLTLSGTDYATLMLTVEALAVSSLADAYNLGYFQITL